MFFSAVFSQNVYLNMYFYACRYAWMFPPLDPDYVAKKTLDAMLTNTYSMFLPCLMYPVYWARWSVL